MKCRSLPQRFNGFVLTPLGAAALLALHTAHALPTDAAVVQGQVKVSQPNATTLLVQQGTDKAIVNWRGFSIGVNETVRFDLPSAQSAILNRVTGFDPSRLLGQMQSNGQVFLLNPNGIVFGAHARVDVGSLVASTLSLSDQDFMAGRIRLGGAGDARGSGPLQGQVRNEGVITAHKGHVVLAGRQVVNAGGIDAEQGRVGLVAASKVLVDVEGDGLLFFEVEGREAQARLDQLGEIKAVGGSVELMAASRAQFADTVLNMAGVVQARSLGQRQGRVVIDGGERGITQVSGTVDASGLGAGERGGQVAVLGNRVGLRDAASVDARGDSGGGQVLVGGDVQGSGATRRAQMTLVASGARIDVSATRQGQGGRVVVWSDGLTSFWGSLKATGAGPGGHGGLAEVSGKGRLDFRGAVDLSAPQGHRGQLLLDPEFLEIGAVRDLDGDGTTPPSGDDVAGDVLAGDPPAAGTSKITAAKVAELLASSDLHLAATQDITVTSAIDASANLQAHGLRLTAGRHMDVQASIKTHDGPVTLSAGQEVRLAAGKEVDAGSGAITLDMGGGASLIQGDLKAGGPITLNAAAGASGSQGGGGTISGAGGLVKAGDGAFTLSTHNTYAGGTEVRAGELVAQANALSGQGAGSLTVGTGATLTLSGHNTVKTLTVQEGGTVAGAGKTLTAASYDLKGGTVTADLGGGALTQSAGHATVSGTVGATTLDINGGTLDLTRLGGGQLAAAAKVTVSGAEGGASKGTLNLAGAETIDELRLQGGVLGVFGAGAPTLTVTTRTELQAGTVGTRLAGATVNKTTDGTVTLHGAVLSGAIHVGGGVLKLGAPNLIADTTSVTVANSLGGGGDSTFDLGGFVDKVGAVTLTSGRIVNGRLGADGYAVAGGTVSADLTQAGAVLTKTGEGTVVLTGANTYGNTVISAGTLQLGDGATGGTLGTGSVANQGQLVIKRDGAVTLSGISGSGGLSQVGSGTTTLAGTNTYTGDTVVQQGRLQAGDHALSAGSALVVNEGAGLSLLADNEVADLSLHGGVIDGLPLTTLQTAGGGRYRLFGGTVNADLGTGVLEQRAGVTHLNGHSEAATVDITGGTLALGGPERLAALADVRVGGGTLALQGFAQTGLNVLTLASGQVLGGSVSARRFEVQQGLITSDLGGGGQGGLVKTGAGEVVLTGTNRYGDTDIQAGTVRIGQGNTGGTLGGGAVHVNGGLVIQRNGAVTLSGLSGSGTLTQAGLGTTTLSGANHHSGATRVAAGELVAGAGALSSASAITVDAGAVLTLTGDNEAARLSLEGGTLDGVGHTLHAARYDLSGGVVNANLGDGAQGLHQLAGVTRLNGTAGAAEVQLEGGTLRLGAAQRLSGTADVQVGSGAVLDLNGHDQRVRAVTSEGALAGPGTLTADRYELRQGSVTADLGGGTLVKTGAGTASLVGRSAATQLRVEGGTLALASAGRLTGTPSITVQNGGRMDVAGGEQAGTLRVDNSRISGPGRVTALAYTLDAATVDAQLGGGHLTQAGGTSTLNATTGATTVDVNAGRLVLGQGDRLNDGAAVTVATGATLDLGAHHDTVGSLTSSGTVAGTGTLTAATYLLHATTIEAHLGAGTLTKSSTGTAVLNGHSGAAQVTVQDGGTLSLGPQGQLSGAAVVNLAGTLQLGGAQSIARLNLLGGSLLGDGRLLNAGQYVLRGGVVQAQLGGGLLVQEAGTTVLSGTAAAQHLAVNGGRLRLVGAQRLTGAPELTVAAPGTLELGGTETAGSIAGDGRLALGAHTLVTGGNDTDTLFAGQIDGSGGLTKQGLGTLSLAGPGIGYTGTTTVAGGTLAGVLGPGVLDVRQGATVVLSADSVVQRLLLRGGVLGGAGHTLTASGGYELHGGTVAADLGAGSLVHASGTSILEGRAAADTVQVQGGALLLGGAQRLSATAAVNLSAGTQLQLGGDQAVGSLAGAGTVTLASSTLSTGGNGQDTTFAGRLTGAGKVIKQGSGTWTLTGQSDHTGGTTIAQGTLRVGDGGHSGGLGGGAVRNDGTLVHERSDDVSLANAITGAGTLIHAGAGRLTLAGAVQIAGAFIAQGPWRNAAALSAGRIESFAAATLAAPVTATAGDQVYRARVATVGPGSLTATGDVIALDSGNDFSSGPLALQARAVQLEAGDHDLRLGAVAVTADSRLHTERSLTLHGDLALLGGGTLELTADAAPSAGPITDPLHQGRAYNFKGAPLGEAGAAIQQVSGRITTAAGSTLDLRATRRGSILIEGSANAIAGRVKALSGPQGDTDQARLSNPASLARLGAVRLTSAQINSAGIEGDVVTLTAGTVTTPAGVIRARLPYDNQQGTLSSLPALTLVLQQPATPNLFGTSAGPGGWLQVSVGNGQGGYLTVRPRHQGNSATAVWLAGAEPPTPFYDGAGQLGEIPVFYNGRAPNTPQVEGALGAVTAVVEDARRARFDEAVRTENVSSRLRTGVIAEVGAGRPATEGGESIRPPATCTPQAGQLRCAD